MTESAGETVLNEKKLVRCPVFRIDLKGRFVNVDDLTEKFIGQPSEYYFGKNISEFLDEPSQVVVEDVLSTGRHFETFFKSVNLTFIDAKNEMHDVGAVISLNFIGGNPANYQFILTSAFPAQLGDTDDSPEPESDLERVGRALYDLGDTIDWNGFSNTVCAGENILYTGFYLYDDGKLSILGEAFRTGSEAGVEPSEENRKHVDVASTKQPLIPSGNESGKNFQYCFPLVCRNRSWGIMRLYSETADQDIFDTYNTVSGMIGKSLYPYVAERWEQKERREMLVGAFWSRLRELDCTFFSFDRDGKISNQYCHFVGDDNSLSASDSVFQIFNCDIGIKIKDPLTDDRLRFPSDSGELEIAKQAIALYRGELRFLKILAVPGDFGNNAEYIALLFPGIRADNIGKDDLQLVDSIVANASVFMEAINKNAVLLSANSYRQLGKDGRNRLNSIQDQCKEYNESLKRITAQLQLLNRTPNRETIDPAKLIEKGALAVDIPGRNIPLYEIGETVSFESDRDIIEEVFRSVFANIVIGGFPKDNPPVKVKATRSDNGIDLRFVCRISAPGDNNDVRLPYYMKANGGDKTVPGLEYNVISRLLRTLGGQIEINREPDGYTVRLGLTF